MSAWGRASQYARMEGRSRRGPLSPRRAPSKACGLRNRGGCAAVNEGIVHGSGLRYQPSVQSTGNQVGGQGCAGAGEIAGWAAEAGRDQGCVLAPVHIGIFPLIDRIIAGGPAEQVILWGVHRVFQRAGLTNAQGAYHCRQQKDAQFQSELTSAP